MSQCVQTFDWYCTWCSPNGGEEISDIYYVCNYKKLYHQKGGEMESLERGKEVGRI